MNGDRAMKLLAAALALLAATPAAAQAPEARALWTISSTDCASVNTDGPSWDECGFQARAVSADLSRILTVSSTDTIQLWDGEGREIRRIAWYDQPGGASGWPHGHALIVGGLGVAVNYSNQLLILDLADGRTILQRLVPEVMSMREFRRGGDRLFVQIYDLEWNTRVRELMVPSGELRDAPGVDFWRFGQGWWIGGGRAPFTVHRADGSSFETQRSCGPVDARYCTDRDIPGRQLRVLDMASGAWRSFDVGRRLDEYGMAHLAPAGDRLFALVCAGRPPYPRGQDCAVRDLEAGRDIYRFEGSSARSKGVVAEDGRPQVWVAAHDEADGRRSVTIVEADGTARVVDAAALARVPVPGGGALVPADDENASVLLDAAGRPLVRLPFAARLCGDLWSGWSGNCILSADRRRLLAPAIRPAADGGEGGSVGLSLYEIPAQSLQAAS
jgi:hypothetical protein